jgi:hypothetical protein
MYRLDQAAQHYSTTIIDSCSGYIKYDQLYRPHALLPFEFPGHKSGCYCNINHTSSVLSIY